MQRCVVQGFGNVGGVAASELRERGATVLAVSDISGGVHAADGLDIPELHEYAAEHGSLEGYDGCERITNEELLELSCDILFVAAREDQLTERERGARQRAAHRRGRERADDARGGRDLRRARHSGRAGHPRECSRGSRT